MMPQASSPTEPQGRTGQLRIRFIGASGNYNTVTTQGHRIHEGISGLGEPGVTSDIVLLPGDFFWSRIPKWHFRFDETWLALIRDVDIVVIVKCALFRGFDKVASRFKAMCERNNVVLVSSPGDGPGADGRRETTDLLSERIADYVVCISRFQKELFADMRDPSTVMYVGEALRPHDGTVEIRPEVRKVIWENPPHQDPKFVPARVGIPRTEFIEFETAIRKFCEDRGASLVTLGVWRDQQSDAEWQDALLGADIAIECKSLGKRYSPYQLQKPAIKVQNYLSLGLPVVCDSLPAYVELAKETKLLLADSVDEWKRSLTLLFESAELRAEMSAAGRRAASASSIPAVAKLYVSCFEKMLTPVRARR